MAQNPTEVISLNVHGEKGTYELVVQQTLQKLEERLAQQALQRQQEPAEEVKVAQKPEAPSSKGEDGNEVNTEFFLP